MSHRAGETSEPEDAAGTQPWNAFKTRPELQPRQNWHRQKVPVELQTIPTDTDLLEKLEKIVAWSLIQSSPPSASEARDVVLDIQEQTSRPNDTGAPVEDTINTVNTHSTQQSVSTDHTASASETRSPLNLPVRVFERLSRPQRRRHKAQHYNISQGVFTSTLDLITTFRPKVEREAETTTPLTTEVPSVECVSCFEDFPQTETATLSCTHSYCKSCLKEMVMTALQNESSYPPKCCLTEIPLQTILLSLDKKQREAYKDKAAEYAIPAQERWYCPNTKCLKWIPPRKSPRLINLNQRCPHCSTRICQICRGTAHRGSNECPQDYGLEATLSLAETEGWRRCFRCRAMVERSEGCRHMTCKCGAQFCYHCGVKWRTCSCTDVEGAQRVAEARRRRDARDAAAAEEAAEIARIIAEVEAMEQREAEERQREAERLEAERRREEENLRRLESLRLQEEEELRRTLRLSAEEELEALQAAFNKLMQAQKQALDNKHVQAEHARTKEHEEDINKQQKDNENLFAKMETNITRRTASIEEKQKAELSAFEAEQEQAEDDMFLQIQMHLQGKPNKDVRERRLRDQFTTQRAQKLEAMDTRFYSETQALKQNAAIELEVLKRASEGKLARIQAKYERELETLVDLVATDRAWFKYLTERRQNMLSANSRLMFEAIDGGEDAIGLTEEMAVTIGPFLGEEGVTDRATKEQPQQQLAPPSPISTIDEPLSHSVAELAADAQYLLQRLSPVSSANDHPAVASDQISSNEAWSFMMGSNINDVKHSHSLAARHTQQARTSSRKSQHQDSNRLSVPSTTYMPYNGDVTMSGALPASQNTSNSHPRPANNVSSTPTAPSLSLPSSQSHNSDNVTSPSSQQANPPHNFVLSQSSLASSTQEDHKFIVIPSLHTRQSSADSSGTMTSGSATSMSSLDNRSPVSVRRTSGSESLTPDSKTQGRRLWPSFWNLRGKGADRYSEEEFNMRMKNTVGDAF